MFRTRRRYKLFVGILLKNIWLDWCYPIRSGLLFVTPYVKSSAWSARFPFDATSSIETIFLLLVILWICPLSSFRCINISLIQCDSKLCVLSIIARSQLHNVEESLLIFMSRLSNHKVRFTPRRTASCTYWYAPNHL